MKVKNLINRMRSSFKNIIKVNVLYFVVFATIFIKSMLFSNIVLTTNADNINLSGLGVIIHAPAYIMSIFIFLSISFLFKKKANSISLLVLNFMASILMFSDLLYFRGFKKLLSVFTFAQYKNLSYVSSSAAGLLHLIDIVFFIDIIVLLFFAKKFIKLSENINPPLNVRLARMLVPVFSLALIVGYSSFYQENWLENKTASKLSVIGYQYLDLSNFLESSTTVKATTQQNTEVEEWFDEKNKFSYDSDYNGMFKGKNVISIQVESLENFVINTKVDEQEITPNINAMLKNSYYFNNIYQQVQAGTSSDCDMLTQTGVYPLTKGTIAYRFPNNVGNTLPVLLRNEEYASHVVHNGMPYYWNKVEYLPHLGFDTVVDYKGMEQSTESFGIGGLTDEEHFKQLSNMISGYSTSNPYYLFTVTETSHTPFNYIPEDQKLLKLNSTLENTKVADYIQSQRYTDQAIGDFIKSLDDKGLLDNTIIVLYGDHEGLHKYYPEDANKLKEQYPWLENDDKVPFIIYSKDIKKGKVFDKVGGQIDIMPTVLSSLGVDSSKFKNTTMGVNLFSDDPGYALLNDGTIVNEEKFTDDQINNIKKSFSVADYITKTDYFSSYYIPSKNYEYNGEQTIPPTNKINKENAD